MRIALVPFLIISAVGFILSLAAHIFALAGKMPPGGEFVMGLHIGIFVVWLPTVLVSMRATKSAKRKDFWKIMLSGLPSWVRYALYVLFAYAVLNFLLFASSHGGTHKSFGPTDIQTIRGFSGHWMVFYGAAFAVLYSVLRSPQLLQERRCLKGHAVAYTDTFCPTCGTELHKCT